MADDLTWWQRLNNRWYAIPAVAQWWAKRNAARSRALVEDDHAIPFAPLRKPLGACRVALITTAGVHLTSQKPFDMENPLGDATWRAIPREAAAVAEGGTITITHKYYDHSDADQDLNVVFPLAHFRELSERGVIGSLSAEHYGFMGHIEGEQAAILQERTSREVAARLRKEGVDFAFLTPA
jgi:D-proline reductase (dithiol) PrdB